VKRDGVDAGWTQNGALRDTRSNWAQIRRYPVYKRVLKWHHWYHTNQQTLTWDAVKWFDDYSVNCKGLRASFYNCATAFRPASLLLRKYSLVPVDNFHLSATAVKAMYTGACNSPSLQYNQTSVSYRLISRPFHPRMSLTLDQKTSWTEGGRMYRWKFNLIYLMKMDRSHDSNTPLYVV